MPMSDEHIPRVSRHRLEDLPALMRELFDQCVADVRRTADPGEDFDEFVDALWE